MNRLLIIFILITAQYVSAQRPYKTESKKAIEMFEQGLSHYNKKEYPAAEKFLRAAIDRDKGFQNAYLVLAEVFWEQSRYDSAISFYSKGLQIDPLFYPFGYYNKGRLEIKAGRYEEAQKSFEEYLRLAPSDPKYASLAGKGIKQAIFASNAVKNPVPFEPNNMGPNVNSPMNDYWPALSADQQTLIITRMVDHYDVLMGKQLQEDFYFSHFENGEWTPMISAGSPLNTPDNEGAQSISANGKFMVYTVCNRKGVIGRCDIYYSEFTDNQWTPSKNIGPPVNTTAKETQPSLSADGNTIYFSSDRQGGKGGLDIWMSKRDENGNWQIPVNLGDSINTPGDEMSPFIHHDNNTLYFSSDGHLGMGGADIFVARRNHKGEFGEVKNLGYPINSPGDEIGFIVNALGNTAYYASDMQKENKKDIYSFELYEEARPNPVSYMKGHVYDSKTAERLQANFELFNLADGSLINKSTSDPQTGEFLVCIPADNDYMLNVDRKGYLFYSDNFALKGVFNIDKPFLKDVPLVPVGAGEKIILKNIFYEFDSYKLLPRSTYELDKVFHFLRSNPGIRVEISGHTDNTGSQEYNRKLSENRAISVVRYLTEKGIEPARLSSKGYGMLQPVDSNETEEGRANNRRTELKIVNESSIN